MGGFFVAFSPVLVADACVDAWDGLDLRSSAIVGVDGGRREFYVALGYGFFKAIRNVELIFWGEDDHLRFH